jgi:hypothetical protein
MADNNLIINCSEVDELIQDYPREMEVIIKMLTEVGEGCHLEITQLKTVVAS